MTTQRAWEGRFALYVLAGWLAAMALFGVLHLAPALRLSAATQVSVDPAAPDPVAARDLGRRLGNPHPFEGWAGPADAADVLAEAAGLPNAEPWEAPAVRDKRRFAAAVASRDAGKPLSVDDAGLFQRRADLWLAYDAGRPDRPADAREAALWLRLLERRRAAVHGGSVFLAYLGLGAALLALAAWGARRGARNAKESKP
jgi:hypothetical protein